VNVQILKAISEKLKSVFLFPCLLYNINKLFIAFKDWTKHLKQEHIQFENHLKHTQLTKQILLGFSNKQSIESTKQLIVLV